MRSILTNSYNTTLLRRSASKLVAKQWSELFGVDVGCTFHKTEIIELWQCNDTGFRWYEPEEAAGGADLYNQLENFSWYYCEEKWEFMVAAEILKKYDNVLEVGCGFGYFLQLAQSKCSSVAGLELNRSAANVARGKAFKVFEEDLDSLADRLGDGSFDVICSFQVLEHVYNPRVFLEQMLRNLKVGGRLIIAVPNSAVMRSVDPNNDVLLNQPPHHMGHWDVSVFQALQSFLPIRLVSIHMEPLSEEHIEWMLVGYLRNFFSFIGPVFARLLINRYSTLPLKLALKAGLRRFIPGHTLLVEFEKRE